MKILIKRRAFLALPFVCAFGVSLGVAGCGGGGSNLPATSANPTGRIAYAQFERAGQNANDSVVRSDIYVINADGSNSKRLTPETSDKDNFSPQISPDGNRVAFVSGSGAKADIYVIHSDGSGLRRITNDGLRESSLNWTRDGQSLIYAVSPNEQSPPQIYRVRIDGASAPQKLFNDNIERFGPVLSPDGRKLAFVTNDDNNESQIFLANADGSQQPRRIFSIGFPGIVQSFTPDGQRLVYSFLPPSTRAGTNVGIVNLDGTPASGSLPIRSYDALSFAYSPDGRYLVYSGNSFDPSPGASNLGRNSKLYVVRADGKDEPKLLAPVDANVVQFSPSWGR